MDDYKNISKIEKLDDGTMNILMKNGMRAYVEIRKWEAAFKASVYRLKEGDVKSLIKELSHSGALADCAREAIGWVDANPLTHLPQEEVHPTPEK